MQREVEIKAWVHDPERLKALLDSVRARHVRDFCKHDRYYRLVLPNAQKQDVRVRIDGSKAMVTFKDKKLIAGIECNSEYEFAISDPVPFEELLFRLGALNLVTKKKTGTAWVYENLLVELSYVDGLGHFVEIEVVADVTDSEKDAWMQLARNRVQAVYQTLSAAGLTIEEKPYTLMLQEKLIVRPGVG